jgi:hypothetical protein
MCSSTACYGLQSAYKDMELPSLELLSFCAGRHDKLNSDQASYHHPTLACFWVCGCCRCACVLWSR